MNPAKRRPFVKDELHSIAHGVWDRVPAMPPRRRRAAIKIVEGLSTTNCGWTLYAIRHGLLSMLYDAETFRGLKAKRKAGT